MNPQNNYFNSIIPTFLDSNSLAFLIFPTINYSIINDILDKHKLKCPICLNIPKSLYKPNACNHYFCKTSIKRWIIIKQSCPICRRAFSEIIKL